MSTVISDPRLQELADCLCQDGICSYCEAFILALNARLEAAEKMAEALNELQRLGNGSEIGRSEGNRIAARALAAYRAASDVGEKQ